MDFWRFQNYASGSNEATLYIYGDIVLYDIENWNWPDDVVPNKFKDQLNALGEVSTIHVRINSGGGSVFAAYAIMNLLKSHRAKIITYNDGIAASAATIIAMAGDKIVTALGSIWMVHLPAVVIWDQMNINELDKLRNRLSTISANMVDVYHHKTGIDKAELEKMLEEETWMTGTQAQEKGFADEVTDLEVVSYLSEDGETAVFNGINVSLGGISKKTALVAMLGQSKPDGILVVPEPTGQGATQFPTPGRDADYRYNEEVKTNPEQLKSQFPANYANAFNEGVAAERERIKEIDEIALPGMDALTNKAKFETGISAGDYAAEVLKAQKQKGIQYLRDAHDDAAEAEIPAAPTPMFMDDEEKALLAFTAKSAKTL